MLSLVYSTAGYCIPVWGRSSPTDLFDIQLNAAMRLVNGTLKSTSLPWFPVLAHNPPEPSSEKCLRYANTRNLLLTKKLLLHDNLVQPHTCLKSCQPFWAAGETLLSSNVNPDDTCQMQWTGSDINNEHLINEPILEPPGFLSAEDSGWPSTILGHYMEDACAWCPNGESRILHSANGDTSNIEYIVNQCPIFSFPAGIAKCTLHLLKPSDGFQTFLLTREHCYFPTKVAAQWLN